MEDSPLILNVNKKCRNLELMEDVLNNEGYAMIGACELEELDEILDESPDVDLALVDVSGFGSDIWDRCQRIHSIGIPFMTISSKQNRELQRTSIATGARGYMTKPLVIQKLLELVRTVTGEGEK